MKKLSSLERAKLSLEGLSVGDAFGEQFFGNPEWAKSMIQHRTLPKPPWIFTDDTVMATGIVEVLDKYGTISQDELATTFARNYRKHPTRGYGGMAHLILAAICRGVDWRKVSSAAFGGMGSLGNGGAMRVAPLGAYFAGDFKKVAEQARLSAEVTHYHSEGQAGAIAVAISAAFVGSSGKTLDSSAGKAMLETAAEYTPDGETRTGIQKALSLPFSRPVEEAVRILGNGSKVTASDTVPFALWCAARHLNNFEEALWATVSGLGDRDTTCAIVGGIVSLSTGIQSIPSEWLNSREPLEDWI